jgi:hypothetical protein
MDAAAIAGVFKGARIDGFYADGALFSEAYAVDGTITYRDAVNGADKGNWSVRGDLFCTFYDRLAGACFVVVRDGPNCFTFYETGAAAGTPRNQWTGRGWRRGIAPTCPGKPDLVA